MSEYGTYSDLMTALLHERTSAVRNPDAQYTYEFHLGGNAFKQDVLGVAEFANAKR